jgi:RNA polymerase sigma-70 factor (ECF subfamily)
MEDTEIIRLIRQSPTDGFTCLLNQYGGLISGIVHRSLPNHPQDAEECMEDVLIAVWKHAEDLLAKSTPLRPWLIVAARNAAIDRLRQNCRSRETALDEAVFIGQDALPITQDREDQAEALVLSMDEPDRAIFIRKYWLMQSSKEIAQALNLRPETVNMRLCRGRQRLKKLLTASAVEEDRNHA